MLQSCPKKKPKTYKSALRQEMAKTFGKFLGAEREQKINNPSKVIETNKYKTSLNDILTPMTSGAVTLSSTIFEKASPIKTPIDNNFPYTIFQEDDDKIYKEPIHNIHEFIQKYIPEQNPSEEDEYDDSDGFCLVPSKPLKLNCNTNCIDDNNSQQDDDEPPTPSFKQPSQSSFDSMEIEIMTATPKKVTPDMFFNVTSSHDDSSILSSTTITNNNSSHDHVFHRTKPKKASIDYFAKPIEMDRLDEEFQSLKKYESRLQRTSGMHLSGYKQHNLSKNRYRNILPNENTRVLLRNRDLREPGSDYINANHITIQTTQTFKHIKLPVPHSYIATQAPLPSTFGDFWRMIVENNSMIIVMLTNEVISSDSESDEMKGDIIDQFDSCFNKNKVNKYWPSIGERKQYDEVVVETVHEELTNYEFVYRQCYIYHDSLPSRKTIHFFQYTGWPDMGVPNSTTSFFKLIDSIDNLLKSDEIIKNSGPIVIHCSAGVGRTGTFCTIHLLLSQFKEYLNWPKEERDKDFTFDFNIYNVVKHLKSFRVGMVQRKEQYRFCYLAVRDGVDQIRKRYSPQHSNSGQ
ncbi:hypothetical protein ABK040_009771 [Willaertia magna]